MTDPNGYELRVTAPAERQLAKLPAKVAAAVVEFIVGPLLENPHRLGGALHRELAGFRSARRGAYRVVYEIDEDLGAVIVHRINHRARGCGHSCVVAKVSFPLYAAAVHR